MSWTHELAPMVPTPAALLRDIGICWREYANHGLPVRTRLGFSALRALQRTAYWAGWIAGAKEHRAWTPP